MEPTLKVKDPQATEPYGFDWTSYLAGLADDAAIESSSWTRSGPDTTLAIANSSIVTGNKKTQMFLAGGTPGARYTITNRITTDGDPAVIDERSFDVLIEDQ